ncbi:hypothetical protein, partial [Neisseria meningitidis]|uniref:hypothetical protein n=1 Tax=Neisseria meningitidis TaxID=487 RepID=UPI001C70374D
AKARQRRTGLKLIHYIEIGFRRRGAREMPSERGRAASDGISAAVYLSCLALRSSSQCSK